MSSTAIDRPRPASAPNVFSRRPKQAAAVRQREDADALPLKFLSVCVSVPHPEKREKKGEDAAFMTNKALGVFDGVGSWARFNIDAGEFSKRLAVNAERVAEREELKGSHLVAKTILTEAVQATPLRGTSTALVAVLNGRRLNVCNVGDGMALVIRNGRAVFASKIQQHSFNTPYQVGFEKRADLSAARVNNVTVENQDIVVMASDGLWDNVQKRTVVWVVSEHVRRWHVSRQGTAKGQNVLEQSTFERDERIEIEDEDEEFSQDRLKAIAFDLATRACRVGYDESAQSPYAEKARRVGRYVKGGKLDDITVTVAIIMHSRSIYRTVYHTKCSLDEI